MMSRVLACLLASTSRFFLSRSRASSASRSFKSFSQSAIQSVSQSFSQSVIQLFSQSFSQSVIQLFSQSFSQSSVRVRIGMTRVFDENPVMYIELAYWLQGKNKNFGSNFWTVKKSRFVRSLFLCIFNLNMKTAQVSIIYAKYRSRKSTV